MSFAFTVWAFVVISKKSSLRSMLRRSFPMFSSGIFMVLGLCLSLQSIWVNFCERYNSIIYFLSTSLCSFLSTICCRVLLKSTIFSPLTDVLSFLVEYLLMVCERLCILSHWPMHLFLQKYHSVLITIPLPYSLKSGSVMPLALFFLLLIALTIQDLL